MLSLTVVVSLPSQGWLPQEGSVRRLLCPDPSCSICNAMTLEIQQLLGVENKKTSSSLLRPSRSFSCLEALSPSKSLADRSSELTYQDTRDVSLSSRFPQSQETDQQSTRSATPSIGDAVLQCYHSAPQQQLDPQGSKMTQDAKGLSSSSTDEPGVPANQQKKRKKTKKLALKNQGQQPLSARLLPIPSTQSFLNLSQHPMPSYSQYLLSLCPKDPKVPLSTGGYKCMCAHNVLLLDL